MFNKKVMVLVVFLVCLLSLSAVSAASDSAGDMVSADMNGEFSLDESNDGLVLSTMVETQSWGSSPKSFTDLNSLINVEYALNDTIFLNDDYVYVGEEDSPFPDEDGDYRNGVVIDRPLSIYGNGFTIDGSHLARIFDVTSSDVVFYNVNFINGSAHDGGAIRGDCTVVDSTFANNEASKGGAMYGGTAINCLFADNSVDFNGGAIYCGNAIDCTFVNNTADGPGGAIYCGNAINCTFANNTAGLYGGAMAGEINNSCNATLCTFEDTSYPYSPQLLYYVNIIYPYLNASSYLSSYGSGEKLLFNLTYGNQTFDGFNTTITVFNGDGFVGEYYGFTGPNGGWVVDLALGFYSATLSLDGYEGVNEVNITITITDGTTFWDLNRTINANDGAVVILSNDYAYNPDYDSDFINGVEISREVTVDGDGHTIDGLHIARIFDITGSDVVIRNINFINANVSSGVGGAIYWNGNRGVITNSTFKNNSAWNRGGAIYYRGNNFSVSNCNFINNTARVQGGAIYYNGTDFSAYNCKFINNSAIIENNDSTAGGAIYCNASSFIVENCNFISNSANDNTTFRASYSAGGAIYCSGNTGSINDCNFTNNTAKDDGGAIYCNCTDCPVSNCNFYNNTGESGGAIYFEGSGTVSICKFEGNIARKLHYFDDGFGGAIYFEGAGEVFNSTFYKNGAITEDHKGGAIYFNDAGVVANSKFYNNICPTGTAIYSYKNTLEIRDSEFLANKAGGGWIELGWSFKLPSYITIKRNCANNLINAIYKYAGNVTLSNVTYWDGEVVNSDDGRDITKFLGVPFNISIEGSDGNTYYNVSYTAYMDNGQIIVPLDMALANYLGKPTFILAHNDDDYYNYFEIRLTLASERNISSSVKINTAENEFILDNCYIDFSIENYTNSYYIIITDENGEVVFEKTVETTSGQDPLISPDPIKKYYEDSIFVDLPAGYYNMTLYNRGTLLVIGSFDSKMIRILPVNSTINVDAASEVVYGNPVSVDISGENLTTVNVTVYDSNRNIVFSQNTTETTLTIPVLPAGTYNITAFNYGNVNISGCEDSAIINVLKASNNAVVSVGDVVYGVGAFVVVTADVDGDYTLNINGTLETVDVVNGTGNVSVSLKPGFYWANATFNNPNYESAIINDTFTVSKAGTNITVFYDDESNEMVVVLTNNATGQTIKGYTLKVKLHGETYKLVTDINGRVRVYAADLTPGTIYTVGVTFKGGTKYNASKVTAKVPIVADTVVSVFYDAETKEMVAVLTNNATGQAIKGFTLHVKLHGETYKLVTDANGQVRISAADLDPGTIYTVSVTFNGGTKYNAAKITAKIPIVADTSVEVGYDEDDGRIIAGLINEDTGDAIKGFTLRVTINNEYYKLVTDEYGLVSVSVAHLAPGDYTVTVVFLGGTKYNPSKTSETICIESLI